MSADLSALSTGKLCILVEKSPCYIPRDSYILGDLFMCTTQKRMFRIRVSKECFMLLRTSFTSEIKICAYGANLVQELIHSHRQHEVAIHLGSSETGSLRNRMS